MNIEQLFEHTLNNKEKVLRTALIGKPLVYLAGKEFAAEYMQKRISANIHLKSLRFSEESEPEEHKDYENQKKEVKRATERYRPERSLVIWDDKVAFVSLEGEIELIENQEKAEQMKEWFDLVWNRAE